MCSWWQTTGSEETFDLRPSSELLSELTAMVWYSDLLWWRLNSVLIFIRSTSQRDAMILVTTFSLAPLLCRKQEAASHRWTSEGRGFSGRGLPSWRRWVCWQSKAAGSQSIPLRRQKHVSRLESNTTWGTLHWCRWHSALLNPWNFWSGAWSWNSDVKVHFLSSVSGAADKLFTLIYFIFIWADRAHIHEHLDQRSSVSCKANANP